MVVRVRALIPYKGRLLFVLMNHENPFWCLPGGKVEPGEGLVSAMKREIFEELSIEPAINRLLYVYQFTKGDEESLEFFFEVTNGEAFTSLDLRRTSHGERELLRTQFFTPGEAEVWPAFLRGVSPIEFDQQGSVWPKVINNL